jgi:hypothetical protein
VVGVGTYARLVKSYLSRRDPELLRKVDDLAERCGWLLDDILRRCYELHNRVGFLGSLGELKRRVDLASSAPPRECAQHYTRSRLWR